eukprot:1258446-Amorphochlora_amoeboformis.AAC.1
MEIQEIVRRSYHPVVLGSTRWYSSVPGSNGLSWDMTKRDVTPYHERLNTVQISTHRAAFTDAI